MTWRIHLLILIALVSSNHAKEETKKALIIAVDELKPEQSDAIISELTIDDQRTSPSYQNNERVQTNKQLDYIIVRPEDLRTLKELGDVSVEKPKHVRYPETGSDESYEVSRYSPYSDSEKPYTVNSAYPDSPREKTKYRIVKYPSRPAPPLSTYSGGDSSKEEPISPDTPHSYKSYPSYNSPGSASYSATVPSDSPQPHSVSNDHGYVGSKPTTYSDTSSYSVPSSSYGSSKPNTYSGTSGYSAPGSSYGSSKPNTYSGTSSFSAPGSSYGSSKSTSHSGPSSYRKSKPSSYSSAPSYGSSDPPNYSGPSTYSGSSSYAPSKTDSYSGSSVYEKPKSSSYPGPPTYENGKPSSYSGSSSYSVPKDEYTKSKPSSYSSYPGSSYPPSKSSSYPEPSSPHYDSSSERIHADSGKYSSAPGAHDHSDKTYSYDDYSPPKSVSHSPEYDTDPRYTKESKPYKSKYYDSPSVVVEPVKHVSYDDLPTPYKDSPHATEYESPHATYSDDSPDDSQKSTYSGSSKQSPRESYTYSSPPKKVYSYPSSHDKERKYVSYDSPSSKPSYGKKLYGISLNPVSYKPRSAYRGNPYTGEAYYVSAAKAKSYPRKNSHDSLKTSYESLHDPASYEEPVKYNTYRYPSSYKASKVTYNMPSTYNSDHHPRSSYSDLKQDSGRPQYENPTVSKPNVEDEYSSPYNPPPSEDMKHKFSGASSSKYDDPTYNDRGTSTSSYGNNSPYKTHSNLEYGSRYPTYRKSRYTDSKVSSPVTSHFTVEDARGPENVPHYGAKKPNSGSTESHHHYDHYEEDSSEIPASHSAKKNYSPVRPAPLHDVLEQPRYPPLPRRSKNKSEKHYGSEEDHSSERDGNYKADPSYTNTKSYNPDPYEPLYTHDKAESHYPTSAENNYRYADHSSEESDEEPTVYTKTTTTTYTKPYKDSSNEHAYSSNGPTKNSYKEATNYPKKPHYVTKDKDFVSSQPEYSRPVYTESKRLSGRYPHSYSPTNQRKYIANSSLPISYSSLSQILPPKRVEGVVYRSRHSYPNVKAVRRQKGYLPYKPYYPRSTSAYSLKPYEGVPSEIREKNVTRDFAVYDLPQKTKSKVSKQPQKEYVAYSSSESNDQSDISNEDSNNDAIPGEAGKDYPVLKEIPYNHFSCDNKLPGFYADVENRCQVYFQCSEEGRMQSFLCPNGTIFNQLTFVCEWWHNVDCSKSEKYFSKNNQLYKTPRGILTPSKSKRTVRDNYEHPETREGDTVVYPSYYADEKEDIRALNTKRLGRSKVRYASEDM